MSGRRDPAEVAQRVGRRYREDMARQGREITQDQAARFVADQLQRNDNKKK